MTEVVTREGKNVGESERVMTGQCVWLAQGEKGWESVSALASHPSKLSWKTEDQVHFWVGRSPGLYSWQGEGLPEMHHSDFHERLKDLPSFPAST